MKISRFLMLLLAMTMIVFTGCTSNSSDNPVVKDKCEGVNCPEGQACDPGDGICYGSTDKCTGVTCAEGEACDKTDGICKEVDIKAMDTIVKARKFSSVSGSQTGIILTEPLEGVVVAVRGLPTSNKHAVVIRQADADEYAGIYVNLDGVKALENFPTLAIGNLVTIKGKLVEYFDRTELQPQSVDDIVVKTASVTVPAPIDVASFGFEEKYESMVLNITNVPFTVTEAVNIKSCTVATDCPAGENVECKNGMCSNNVYDTTLTNADNKTIVVSSSFAYPRVELALGDIVNTLAGVMTFDYGEFKLYPRDVADVGATPSVCDPACSDTQMCVNSECVDKADENTDALCSDGIDNDGDGFKDCDDYDCSKSDTVTVCKVTCGGVECASGEVCINDACETPVPEKDDDTLCSDGIDNDGNGFIDCEDFGCSKSTVVTVCKVTCGGVECAAGQTCVNDVCTDPVVDNCADVTCAAGEACDPADGSCKAVETKTILEIRTAEAGLSNDGFADGGTYTTSGVVTAILPSGTHNGFFIQDGTAAGINVYTGSDAVTVSVGDKVNVTGMASNYYGLLRIVDGTISTDGTEAVPAFTEVAATNLVEANESMLVKITGGPFTVISTDTHSNTTVSDASGNEFVILDTLFAYTTPMDGTVYNNLQGVLTFSYGAYKLMPRNDDDMASVSFDCSANPCSAWEYCSADDTCTMTPGMCDDMGAGCDAGYTCNTTTYACELTGSDVLVNGDFEAWTANVVDAWTVNSGLTVEKDEAVKNGGAASAKITRLADVSNGEAELSSTNVAVTVGKTYTLSAYALDNTDQVNIKLVYAWYDADGNFISNSYTVASADNTDWQELTTVTDPAPAATDTKGAAATLKVAFRVYKENGGTTGTVNLDDVTVTEVAR